MQRRMQNPPLIGVHWLQHHTPSCLGDFGCDPVSEVHKRLFPLFTIIFRVQEDAPVLFRILIDDQAGQVLQAVQGFPAPPDEHARRIAIHLDADHLFALLRVCHGRNAHAPEKAIQKLFRMVRCPEFPRQPHRR